MVRDADSERGRRNGRFPAGLAPRPVSALLVTLVVGHVCSEEGTAHILQLAF